MRHCALFLALCATFPEKDIRTAFRTLGLRWLHVVVARALRLWKNWRGATERVTHILIRGTLAHLELFLLLRFCVSLLSGFHGQVQGRPKPGYHNRTWKSTTGGLWT